MDVPFISSGASSRAHYSLVRQLESADDHSGHQHILAAIKDAQQSFSSASLSIKECKKLLILLLYCSVTATSAVNHLLEFALHHAVNLAETGRTVSDKRLGYLFCNELMPHDHELRLMLVNTLRKDLESQHVPRICLALDNLITSSTRDFIPAVQTRLLSLLSHNSPQVRQRVILAFRALSRHEPNFLDSMSGRLVRRVDDRDAAVVDAALLIIAELRGVREEAVHNTLPKLLDKASRGLSTPPCSTLRLLHTLIIRQPSDDMVAPVLQLLGAALQHRKHALVLEVFFLLSRIDYKKLPTAPRHPIQLIRDLLPSNKPNDKYLFLACLESIEPVSWAGTSPDISAILEGWEVGMVMGLLESTDILIRKKTMGILRKIDSNILGAYFQSSLKMVRPEATLVEKNDFVRRLLELLEIQFVDDGEAFAQHVVELLGVFEDDISGSILDSAVELVLARVRQSSDLFQIGCATTLVTMVTNEGSVSGPTLTVIISTLACEYCGKLSISPKDILQGFALRLSAYGLAVQEICLLSMLRVAAECESIPEDVTNVVAVLQNSARRHLRKRCDEFLTFCSKPELLKQVINKAPSPSLPDFVAALTAHITQAASESRSPHVSVLSSPAQRPAPVGQLRYDAYDTPSPPPSLRNRQLLSPRQDPTQLGPVSRGSSGLSRRSDQSSNDGIPSVNTAGILTLAASTQDLGSLVKTDVADPRVAEDTQVSRPDLIAFDPPSAPKSPEGEKEESYGIFKDFWDSFDGSDGPRGWCGISTDEVVTMLQKLDRSNVTVLPARVAPFPGDLKVLISADNQLLGQFAPYAALRLRNSEENGCLWRLKCLDPSLQQTIKQMLGDR